MSKPDLVELLAHLDYLVTGPRQKSLSSEQWEEHMQKTLIELKAEFDNRYTTECIHDLLFAEFRRATAWPEFNMRRLFGHGSAELLLTPEMRKKVKDQLTLIQVRGPRKTRQSRSASSNRTRSLNTKAQKSGRLEARPKRSKLKKESNSMRVQSPQVRIYQSVDSASLQLPTPNGTVHVLPRELEVKETPCNSPLASVASKSIDKDVLELRQVPGDNTDVSSCRFELSDEKACSQEVGSHATASFRAMQNELSYYKQRCERAEEHLKATQKNNRRLKSMLEDPEDTLELLSTKDKRVRALEMELEARDKMGNYLDLSGLEAAQSHSQQLSVHFDTLKKDFSSIRVINSKKQYSITDLLGLSIDLNALMSAILPIGGPDALNGTPIINPAFTLYDITQALAGAAIHLWIFETPVAWHSLGTTPILQAYRRHIGMICGKNNLYALDSIAHRSLMDEEPFSDMIIPRLASTHTRRLLTALDPLFDPDMRQETIRRLKPSLRGLFHLATQIRFTALTGNECYESIWPQAQSAFDSNDMESTSFRPEQAHIVRLPICPGIRAYPRTDINVDYGFGQHTASGPAKYVIKATVLT